MDPIVCIVIIAVTFIISIYYFVTHKIVEGVCIENKRHVSGPGFSHCCQYQYELDNTIYVGDGVSCFKQKVGKKYKLFVNPKKLDKVSPCSSIINLLTIGVVLLLIFIASLVAGQISF